MSTVNDTPSAETSPKIILREPAPQRTEPKVTAAQIEMGCPARLQWIGEEITKRVNEAQEQTKLLDDHVIELKKLIAEAKGLCDGGGFDAFRERFFPTLRKSRVYELLAIGTNKKSVQDIKAGTRARVAKHRAKKAEVPDSVTVTEDPEPKAQGAPTEDGKVHSIVPEQTPEPAKPPSSVSPGDGALIGFSTVVCKLVQITRNKTAERYAKTSVSADELARIGKFLTDVANLKMSEADVPVLSSNDAVSAEQAAEDMKADAAAGEELRR
jgi:hypothetical protein